MGLATFAVVMVLAGRQAGRRIGPAPVAMAGGIVLGIGYILGGLVGKTFWRSSSASACIGGAGIGLGYVVPIAVGVKWFPDKKGLITGLGGGRFRFWRDALGQVGRRIQDHPVVVPATLPAC